MPPSRQHPHYGYALCAALVAALLLPLGDALVKQLVLVHAIILVAWARDAVMSVTIGVMTAHRLGVAGLIPRARRLQLVRGALALAITVSHYLSLKWLPLAEVAAITFLAPAMAIGIAWLFLHEKVGTRVQLALLICTLGVVAITRPGGALFTWSALMPMATALSIAIYLTITRAVASRDHPLTTTFVSSSIALIVWSTALFWMPFSALSGTEWVMLFAVGAIAAVGQLLTAVAYREGPTSLVAPVAYVSLIVAVIVGWIVFGSVPDQLSAAGMMLITVGGVIVATTRRPALARPSPRQ